MEFTPELAAALSPLCGLPADAIEGMLVTPPNPELGDLAFPCFQLAKTLKKAPPAVAAELAERFAPLSFVERVAAAGPYLNFTFSRAELAKRVLTRVFADGDRYGGSGMGNGKTVCIDYSSINIAKPFHIGHLRSTVIGNALYRIYTHMGYTCVGINHLGDWGTQFGKMIVAFLKWGDRAAVEAEGVSALVALYVRFHEEAENDPALNDEARAWFKKIEDGDPEALRLFDWFKELTLAEVGRVYELLGIRFDSYAGESFYNDKMDRVVEELRQKNLLKLDDGASIVDLAEYKMPPCIILRSDGATLYATRDIAAALYRKDAYDFDKCLYVVAYQQDLHFRQWFKVVELLGYPWHKDLMHVSFGMVSVKDGTLSTRKGNVIYLRDVLRAAAKKTRAIMEEKSPDLPDMRRVAAEVGVGAVVFSSLYNGRIKDIVFDWDTALNFDGETGPYAQYTHARACSVLRKSPRPDGEIDYSLLTDDESRAVVSAIAAFPAAVAEAMDKNEPYLVERAVIALCQAFNRFYYEQRIVADEIELRKARLALTDAARQVIKTGLYLVGLAAPERM